MQRHIFKVTPRFLHCIVPLALSSSALYAAPVMMTQHPTWDIGVHALYLKPTFSGELDYLNDTAISPTQNRKNLIKSDWGFGYQLEASYHFCPHSDLNLNWYHYSKSAHGSFVYLSNPTRDHYTFTPRWDAVNLEYGHDLLFDEIKHLRLHGGLQYAQVKGKYNGHGIDPQAGPGTEYLSMKFSGVGPRIGADLSVGVFTHGLALYINGDAALLGGHSKFRYHETFGEPFTSTGSKVIVVPEMGLKLGVKYDHPVGCGNLTFDVGYMFVNYFNVIHDNFTGTESNFALHGGYFGIKWTG